MIIIGENIHVIAGAVNRAVKERDPRVIQDLAKVRLMPEPIIWT